jgi:NADH-quinone oxidoreductase subunit J
VLFLFVIMLLNLGAEERPLLDHATAMKRRLPIVMLVGIGFAALSFFAVVGQDEVAASGNAALAEVDTITGIAELLFGAYLLPFEVASVLLLAAAIAVLVLAKREGKGAQR